MEAVNEVKPANRFLQLLTVSLGHFINDFYIMLLPPILFLFAQAMSLSLTEQAVIAAVITGSSSFAQPVLGYLVDKRGKPWLLILSVVWIAFWMSISGLATNYFLLVFITGLGALASALYHPLGSAIAVSLGNNTKGRSLAIFMTVGGLAASISPIVAIPFVQTFGLSKLPYLMFPGFIIAGFMYISQIHKIEFQPNTLRRATEHSKLNFYAFKWLSALVFIATIRIMIMSSLMSFGIQLLSLKDIDIKIASIVLFLYLLVTSAGTLLGGYLSDTISNKKIFIISNVLLTMSLMLLVWGKGISVIIGFILVGLTLNIANTSNIVIAQDLIPQNLNLATGLIMGLAGGLGGLGIVLYGKLADSYGLVFAAALWLVPLVLVNVLTMLLPNDQKLENETINIRA